MHYLCIYIYIYCLGSFARIYIFIDFKRDFNTCYEYLYENHHKTFNEHPYDYLPANTFTIRTAGRRGAPRHETKGDRVKVFVKGA